MIVGTVQPDGDAVVSIRVRGPGGRSLQFEAVVDSGFNDSLTLNPKDIATLALPFREEGHYTLADGSEATARLFAAEVEWFGQWRRLLVAQMGGMPLMGMALMQGSRLTINVVDGGRVEIRPLNG